MTGKKSIIRNNKLFFAVVFLYALLALFMPSKALESVNNSLYYVKEMIMIMPVILLLTSLITAWVPKESIEKNLGKDSGFKGSIFSFLLGSFSAGPIYAAFPVCKALFIKGASISNIIIILSTWAVLKVPMLINESKFLGPKFMIARWILTTISIFLMGYITSKFVSKEDIPLDNLDTTAKETGLSINADYCIGCGICVKKSPKHFKMQNKKAIVINQDIKKEDLQAINEAIKKCPTKSIR